MAPLPGGVTLADLVGTTGTLLVALAYLGTQLRRLDAAGLAFPFVNLVGSALISVSLWWHFNLASVLMEMFWMAVSLLGILRWLRERRGAR